MKETRYCWNTYCPFDLRGTAEHLSSQAARGWRLEKIGKVFWKYRRGEPAKLHYAITCPPAAGEDGELGDRLFFQELCESAGWEKAADWEELQIYASEQERPTPLETDGALLLERIHGSMRWTWLRNRYTTALLLAVCFSLLMRSMLQRSHSYFLNGIELLLTAVCPLLILGELWSIGGYYRWRRRSLRALEEGGEPAPVPRSCRVLNGLAYLLSIFLILTFLTILLSPESSRDSFSMTVSLLMNFLVVAAFYPLNRWWDRRGTPGSTRFLACFLGLAVLVLCLGYYHPDLPERRGPEKGPSYVWKDEIWNSAPQPIPLTVEDLTGEPWDHVRRTVRLEGRTPFAAETVYSESAAQEDGREAYLQYTVLEAPEAWVCRAILEDLLNGPDIWTYHSEDPAPWNAEAAYRRSGNNLPAEDWLLCWPGRIVTVYTQNLSLDGTQKALAAACLGPESGEEVPS